jgi:protein TonB
VQAVYPRSSTALPGAEDKQPVSNPEMHYPRRCRFPMPVGANGEKGNAVFQASLLECALPQRRRWPAAAAYALEFAGFALVILIPLLSRVGPPEILSSRTIVSFGGSSPTVPQHGTPGAQLHPNSIPRTNGPIYIRPGSKPTVSIGDLRRPGDDVLPLCFANCVGNTMGDNTVPDFLANPSPATPPKPPESPKTARIHFSEPDPGWLVHRVEPVYPELAKRAGIQGTVVLAAVIARDGSIQSLRAVNGNPLLARAAIDAVSQWKYRPYMLNHAPVEVDTQIAVIFRVER